MYNQYMDNIPNKKANEPIKILNRNIPTTEVAKYYLEIELYKLFKNSSEEMAETITSTIQQLPENKIWALLEAMSFTYHINGVFYKISRAAYTWNEEVWHVKDLVLTGMDSKANKVIFSDEVNGDALKFKNYLLSYFEDADESDPEGLLSYKPKNKKIIFNKLIMTEEKGAIRMLDGSHRLTEMLLADIYEVTAYVGHPTSAFSEDTQKVRIGNSTFIMLSIMYKRGNPEERKAVLILVKQLVGYSIDGKEAVKKFWVDQQRDEEIVAAGMKILELP
jgi:hypothetical protein